jgi:TetR/AcrR family transcriptional regulator, transcriptional repressor for nem operon
MEDTRTRLLNAASQLVQTRGYNGFSYHDLAGMIGIKTASIHYYFPAKADLGQTLVERYSAGFMENLGSPQRGSAVERLEHYVGLFRASLSEGRMCLCGMIGAEVDSVPDLITIQVEAFFEANVAWLSEVFERLGDGGPKARGNARALVAALEGAMMMSRVKGDLATFDNVAQVMLGATATTG